MKQESKIKGFVFLPVKTITVLVIVCSLVAIVSSSFDTRNDFTVGNTNATINKDSVESVKAFMQIYKVLMSPRCLNCHPSGDVPLQGDDSHLHTMSPRRGEDGHGVYAMKCSNCHQPTNAPGLHTPPGNPNWHLPAADMKLVFQGRTANELAKQLLDPSQNGHKSKEQLIAHASDGLVMAAWNPGEGRTLPPMSYDDFKKAWVMWIEKGAYAP